MSATGESIATPFQKPHSEATEYQALQFLLLQRLMKVQTSILVEIEAVHGGGLGPVGTVDVLPLVDQVDGAGNAVPHQTIYGRPYIRWQGGNNAVILDPQAGDLGLCVFCSRDISSVIASKEHGPPASGRIFSYADGLYVGGALNGTPTSYLQWLANGTINVVSPQAVNIQCLNATLDVEDTLTIDAATVNITAALNITGPVNANGAQISEAGEITDADGVVLGTHDHEPGSYVAGSTPVTGTSGAPT
jgi:hypothetical protein